MCKCIFFFFGFPLKGPSLGLSPLVVFQDLATPEAFSRDPSLVWEFYHYRREVGHTLLTKWLPIS